MLLPSQPIFRVSTLEDGNMAWRWGIAGEVLGNRSEWLKSVGVEPQSVALASLVGSDAIRLIGESDLGWGMLSFDDSLPDADILLTSTPGARLMMVVADCLSIAVFDPAHSAIGLAHAGHPGVNLEVPRKLIAAMVREFGSRPQDLEVHISPARDTHQATYDDHFLATRFTAHFWPHYTTPSGDAVRPWKVDWIQAALDQLESCGVVVPGYPEDTYTGPYFSHRRSEATGEPEGRFAVLAGFM
ncbi:peptidoglycan editing factor PgeF [soil metagenome]